MPQLHKFDGNLLHNIRNVQTFPENSVADGADGESTIEFTVFPSSCLQLCVGSLPVLKSVKCYIQYPSILDIQVPAGGYLIMQGTLWNLDGNFIPEDPDDGESDFECLGGFELNIVDLDGSASLNIPYLDRILDKKYGNNGVILRPTISALINLQNNTDSGINPDSFRVVLEMDIDWVPISDSEWDDYLRELWLIQSLGDN